MAVVAGGGGGSVAGGGRGGGAGCRGGGEWWTEHLGEQALKVVLGHDLDGAGADGVPDLVAVGRDAALDVKEGGAALDGDGR